jgi:hypothetical protein
MDLRDIAVSSCPRGVACVDVGDDAARPFYRRHGAVELNRHWMVWNDIGQVLATTHQQT